MLATAPASWDIMAKELRPVATSSFSSIHCQKQPKLKISTMDRYATP